MGEVAISALVNVVLARLTTFKDLIGGREDDILTMTNHFEMIKAYVEDAEERRSRESEVDLWLKSLRSAIEQILDDVLTEAMLQSLYKETGIRSRYTTFFSIDHNQLMFGFRIGRRVKNIRRTLDDIASQMPKSLTSRGTSHVDRDVEGKIQHRKTSSIFGRYGDLKMVIETLCNKDIGIHESGKIRVLGIWGMEGVGKTALAKQVCKHKKVNKCFKFKYWVNVNKISQAKEIMIKIIKEIDNGKCELTHIDSLQGYIQRKLSGKKFLIVLDDISIVDEVEWDLLRETMCGGTEGSILMITTWSKVTWKMMAKVPGLQHELKPLSKEDSWLLFKRVAFEGQEEADIRELQPIGWKIVEKCDGVPSTVISLARLLRLKKSKHAWMNVMKNKLQAGLLGAEMVKEDITLSQKEVTLDDLNSSYDELLPHIKRCFNYCLMFPKDYDIEKVVAIELWVVNNFIPLKGKTDLSAHGEQIFDYLVNKSLFQVVKDKKHSNLRFKVHNLMHDMATQVLGADLFVMKPESEKVTIPNTVIHLSSSFPGFCFPTQNSEKLTHLRSIFMFGKINEGCISQIYNHTCLRVLYLCGIGLRKLPDSICQLKNLEYLNLSYSSIEVLPDKIFYLQKLEMLLLNCCYELCKLPEGLRYMKSLRLLDIRSCHSLQHSPTAIKAITHVRQHPRLHVGKNIGVKLEELGDLTHLEGELEISGLENVENLDEANAAKLKNNEKLSILKLRWSNIDMRESNREMFASDEKVLEKLEPNPNLEQLHIFFYMGERFAPTWMLNLNHLVEIAFSGCTRCKSILALGTLTSLRVIKLMGMTSLEGFHTEDFSKETNIFIGLQELHVFLCPSLVFLPSKLPKLQVLRLVECGALTSLPAEIFSGLKLLEISRCKHLSKRYKNNGRSDRHSIPGNCKTRIDSPVTSEDEDEDDNEE